VDLHDGSQKSHEWLRSDEGIHLATNIQSMLNVITPLKDRGVKEEEFAVLRLTDMPVVLVECGFLSSEEDRGI